MEAVWELVTASERGSGHRQQAPSAENRVEGTGLRHHTAVVPDTPNRSFNWRSTFVGRSQELDALRHRFGQVAPILFHQARGEPAESTGLPAPSLVVLRGESGLGKSRIVQEFYRRIACSTSEADLPLDPDDYWPDAFGDPDASGKLVNPVIPTDHTKGKVPPFLWWGVQWPEPAPGQPPTRAAFLDGGYLDCLEAHFEGVRQRFSRAMSLARKAGGLALRNISFGMIDGDLVLDAADGLGRISERLEAAKRLFVGHDHATRVHERGRDRLRDLQTRLRAILRPPGVGPLHDASTPLILWLDDAQWMTADEVGMLHQLWNEARADHLPLLIIATHWETPWLQQQERELPLDADGRPAPDSFATFARTVAEDRIEIHDISADLDFSVPLAAAMPGITEGQTSLILTKAHGHPLLFRLIVDHYLHRPRSFEDRDPTRPLAERALRDLEGIAVDAALNTFARRKVRDLDDTVREVLGWSSVQGVRFLRQVTAEIARIELDSDEPVTAALDTAVDPEAIIQIAGSANQRAFRQNIFREIMLSDLGSDRPHIEACVREVTLAWLTAGDLESRLEDAELDDFLLLATSHLKRSEAVLDPTSPEHRGWLEAARIRIERALDGGQTTLAAAVAREIRDALASLADADWTHLAPPSAAPSLEALHRGGTTAEVREFVDECEARLSRTNLTSPDSRAAALTVARLWRAAGNIHRFTGSPRRQLLCFQAAERSLARLPDEDDGETLYALARARHYQASARQELDGDATVVPAYREVVGLWKRLLQIRPDDVASLDGLGGTLNNLSNCEPDGLLAAQASKDALEVKVRALHLGGETLSRLVLVMNAYGTHSLRLDAIGDHAAATEARDRALDIAHRLLTEAPEDAHAVEAALHWLCNAMDAAEEQFRFRHAAELAEQAAEGGMRLVDRAGPSLNSIRYILRAAQQWQALGQRLDDSRAIDRAATITEQAELSLFEISRPTPGLSAFLAQVILVRHHGGRPLPEGAFDRCWARLLDQLDSEGGLESRLELLDAADSMISAIDDAASAQALASVIIPVLDGTEAMVSSEGDEITLDQTRRILEFRRRIAAQLEDTNVLREVVPRLVEILERLLNGVDDVELTRRGRRRLAAILWMHHEHLPDPEAARDRSLDIRESLALDLHAPAASLSTTDLAMLSRSLEEFVDALPDGERMAARVEALLRVIEIDLELLSRPGDRASIPDWLIQSGCSLTVAFKAEGEPESLRSAVAARIRAIFIAIRALKPESTPDDLSPVGFLEFKTRAVVAGFGEEISEHPADTPHARVADKILTRLGAASKATERHDLLLLIELLQESNTAPVPVEEWRRRLTGEFDRQIMEEGGPAEGWTDAATRMLLDLNGLRRKILLHLGDRYAARESLASRRRILEWRIKHLDDDKAREELETMDLAAGEPQEE